MNNMENINSMGTAWVCYMALTSKVTSKKVQMSCLMIAGFSSPQLDPPLFYGNSSLIDAAIHEALPVLDQVQAT
ncbi:TPA: hypothetical protein ACH3X1_013027 [Trebouxia sp. C0004]